MAKVLFAIVFILYHPISLLGHDLLSWRSRSIYQVVTDRFAGSLSPCEDLSDYCGGTFVGLAQRLTYVTELGFSAMWISPVVANTQGGYHGYWVRDLTQVNPHLGEAIDLRRLIESAHNSGLWMMLDVVVNHMGYPEEDQGWGTFTPFNKSSHYHDCQGCDDNCNISPGAFQHHDMKVIEHCRLAGLPDLDQDHPSVRSYLLTWIKQLLSSFPFDGIRVDTVPEVPRPFIHQLYEAAGVFSIGEVFDSEVEYVAWWQDQEAALPSVLSYPMFFTLREVFAYQESMSRLRDMRERYRKNFKDVTLLGTFVDNHDHPRFLSIQPDLLLYQNALTWVLLAEGIPIVYYGSEQGYHGGPDPLNREPLWWSRYDRQGTLYVFIRKLNEIRTSQQLWGAMQDDLLAEQQCYAFCRGHVLVVLSNIGSDGGGKGKTRDHVCVIGVRGKCTAGTLWEELLWGEESLTTDQASRVQVDVTDGRPRVYLSSQTGGVL